MDAVVNDFARQSGAQRRPAPEPGAEQLRAGSGQTRWDAAFWGEMAALALAAPLLYFPQRLPAWLWAGGLLLLAAGWVWRRRQLGYWWRRTPADWPLLFLGLVALPLSIWVAPPSLRQEYSLPRALILLWNLALFATVVVHCGRSAVLQRWCVSGLLGAGLLVAIVALFGTQWSDKLAVLPPLIDRFPPVLLGVFRGAEEGFSPNQLAGTLLTVLPLLLALVGFELLTQRRWPYVVGGGLSLLVIGGVLLASQSRSGLAGLAVALAVLGLAPWRWGRRLLLLAAALGVVLLFVLPIPALLIQLDASTSSDVGFSGVNIAGRLEIWSRALLALGDFPLTGIGLGTFRRLVPLLYPLTVVPMDYDIAHAHNFYLQSALDLGLPGLLALLAVIGAAAWQGARQWAAAPPGRAKVVLLGLLAGLAGVSIYSLADAVALGAKTNFFFWLLLALLLGIGYSSDGGRAQA